MVPHNGTRGACPTTSPTMPAVGSSSVAGGVGGRDQQNGDVDDGHGVAVDNLWDSTLVFTDTAVERRYQEESLVAKTEHEKYVHPQGILPSTMLPMSQWRSISWVGLSWLLTNSLVAAPAVAILSLRKQSLYMKYRTPLVVVLMLHTMLVYCFLAEDAPSSRWYQIIARITLRSPCGVALFFGLNFSIGFRHQIVFQLCTLPGLIMWASKFCSVCSIENPLLEDVFKRMDYIIGNFLWMFRKLENEGGSCLAVVGMLVLLMGFLLPLLIVYMVEVVRRESFALQHFPELANSRALEQTISDSRQRAAFYFIAGTEVAWMVCCGMGA